MLNKLTQKSWLSPFLFVTYIAVSVTGVLMLFHINFYGMRPIHEWGGLAFVIAGILHLVVNWKRFTSYFTQSKQKRKAIWGAGIATALMVLLAVSISSDNDHHRHRDHDRYSQTNTGTEIMSYANKK